MRVLLLILAWPLLCGCDPGAMKRVRLSVAAPAGPAPAATATSVSVEDSEVPDALKIVNAVVRGSGLGSGGDYPDPQAHVIRWYGLTTAQVQAAGRPSLTCRVYLREENLEVLFTEFPKWTSRPDVVKMRDEIRAQFIERFGRERVH
jgi:hypothetical protein